MDSDLEQTTGIIDVYCNFYYSAKNINYTVQLSISVVKQHLL